MRLADELKYQTMTAGGPGSGPRPGNKYDEVAMKHGYNRVFPGIFKDHYTHPDFHDLNVQKRGSGKGNWKYGTGDIQRKAGNSPEELDKYLGGIKKLGRANPAIARDDNLSPRQMFEQLKDSKLQHPA